MLCFRDVKFYCVKHEQIYSDSTQKQNVSKCAGRSYGVKISRQKDVYCVFSTTASHLHLVVQSMLRTGLGYTELPPSSHETLALHLRHGLKIVSSSLWGNSLHSLPLHMCNYRRRLLCQISICSYKIITSA